MLSLSLSFVVSFDRDGTGDIEISELVTGLRSFGIELSPDEFKGLVEDMDRKKTGKLSQQEFMQMVQSRKNVGVTRVDGEGSEASSEADPLQSAWELLFAAAEKDEKLWGRSINMLFKSFDREGEGAVKLADFTDAVKALVKKLIGSALSTEQELCLRESLDVHETGNITFSEFVAMYDEAREFYEWDGSDHGDSQDMHKPNKAAADEAWEKIAKMAKEDPAVWARSLKMLFLR